VSFLTLKFINKPTEIFDNFMLVSNCALWVLLNVSTAFNISCQFAMSTKKAEAFPPRPFESLM